MHLHLEITHSPTQMIQSKKILGNKTTKKLRSHCSLVHIQRAISQEQAYNTTSKLNTLLINVYIWVGVETNLNSFLVVSLLYSSFAFVMNVALFRNTQLWFSCRPLSELFRCCPLPFLSVWFISSEYQIWFGGVSLGEQLSGNWRLNGV